MKIIAATNNKGKIREICEIFNNLGIEAVSQSEAGITAEAEETGNTFAENALIKARSAALRCNEIVIADDSGLCVSALDGRPGIYSARYAGENASDKDRVDKLLSELSGVKNREAEFVCAIALILPDGREFTSEGRVKGEIMNEPHGDNGFGYDPVFYCTELGKCFAVASQEEKNSVSHRGRALKAMYDIIKPIITNQEEN